MRAPRVGDRTRWSDGAVARRRGGTRATSTATADCRSVANAARSSRRAEPDHRVDGQGGQRACPSPRCWRSLPTSDTVHAFTTIRYAAERRSATSLGSMATLCNTSGATTRWQAPAARRTKRSVIPPHTAFLGQLDQAVGLQGPSSDSSPSDGSTRPSQRPWQPTRVQSVRRGSKPGSDRAPSPRRQRRRALEDRPRSPRYPLTVNIVKARLRGRCHAGPMTGIRRSGAVDAAVGGDVVVDRSDLRARASWRLSVEGVRRRARG